MLKNELNISLGLLDLFALLADLNYLGLVRDYDVAPEILPHHKPQRSKKKPLAALTDAQRAELGISVGLVRLSVGIEPVEELLGDLAHALGHN